MIVKILSRNNPSYSSLIDYILKGSKAKDHEPQIFTHNLRSETKQGWVKEYIDNEALRQNHRSNQIYLYHEILSFSNKEDEGAISKEVLDDIGKQYIALRGHDGLFVGAVHHDKEHTHIHFCTSGVKFRTGKAFRLSKYDLQGVKIRLQEYHKEKYPEIKQSFPEHSNGREYVTNREWQARYKDERAIAKVKIQQEVQECFTKAKTQKEFLELLRDKNLPHYERNGMATGIVHGEMKIRFSRLDISKEQFLSKPQDRTEDAKALSAIRRIRESKEKNKEFLDKER